MKFLLFLLPALVVGCGTVPAGPEPPQALLAFEGKDFMDLTKEEFLRAGDLFHEWARDAKSGESLIWRFAGIWNLGRATWLALEMNWSGKVPGADRARFLVLDAGGRTISSAEFYLGWRHGMTRIVRVPIEGISDPVLRMDMENMASGSPGDKHSYYAVIGTEVALIRLETAEGQYLVNDYCEINWAVGPTPPLRTEEAWLQALAAAAPVERLRTLAWLEGTWANSSIHYPTNPVDHVESVWALHSSPRIKAAVRGLRSDSNAWVREAAERAAGR